ncbi:MAG: OprO/OprP family phosphate-selective porin [Bacteroidales bacterium]|jgi:hypothetical protein|nr:OprO/OprP family phosphate-selective porin [Bacteroidales bacterium]
MKIVRNICFLFVGFVVISTSLCSQNQSDSAFVEKVRKWENFVSKMPKFSGFVNARYQWGDNLSSFDIRRVRLSVTGDINKMFDYKMQIEFMSPKILDAYARVKIKPYFSVQAGQFKVPFSIESAYSPLTMECADNSLAISKLVGYSDLSGISANGRDIGVMIYGSAGKMTSKRGKDFYVFNYSVGIFNGNGINIKDRNLNKDVVGRININPLKDLTISASGYYGSYYANDSTQYATRNRASAGILYDDQKLLIRGEYTHGWTNKVESYGFNAVAAYTFIKKLQPILRFDYFKENILQQEVQMNYTASFKYLIVKNFGLQISYTYQTFKDKSKNSGLLDLVMIASF